MYNQEQTNVISKLKSSVFKNALYGVIMSIILIALLMTFLFVEFPQVALDESIFQSAQASDYIQEGAKENTKGKEKNNREFYIFPDDDLVVTKQSFYQMLFEREELAENWSKRFLPYLAPYEWVTGGENYKGISKLYDAETLSKALICGIVASSAILGMFGGVIFAIINLIINIIKLVKVMSKSPSSNDYVINIGYKLSNGKPVKSLNIILTLIPMALIFIAPIYCLFKMPLMVYCNSVNALVITPIVLLVAQIVFEYLSRKYQKTAYDTSRHYMSVIHALKQSKTSI